MTGTDQERRWNRFMRAGIVTAMLSPTLGIGLTVFGLMRAFHELEKTPAVGDPSRLSKPIGEVLIASAAGVPLGLAGLVTAIVSRKKIKSLKRDHAPP